MKNIHEMADDIAEKMCKDYCKYNDRIEAGESIEEKQFLEEKYCGKCPLDFLRG